MQQPLGQSELLRWAQSTTGVPLPSLSSIADGKALYRLALNTFPTARPQKHINGSKDAWIALGEVLREVGMPATLLSKRRIQQNDTTACYSALVVFYFLTQLTRCNDFAADFADEVDSNVIAFLQSFDSVNALVAGGALQPMTQPQNSPSPETNGGQRVEEASPLPTQPHIQKPHRTASHSHSDSAHYLSQTRGASSQPQSVELEQLKDMLDELQRDTAAASSRSAAEVAAAKNFFEFELDKQRNSFEIAVQSVSTSMIQSMLQWVAVFVKGGRTSPSNSIQNKLDAMTAIVNDHKAKLSALRDVVSKTQAKWSNAEVAFDIESICQRKVAAVIAMKDSEISALQRELSDCREKVLSHLNGTLQPIDRMNADAGKSQSEVVHIGGVEPMSLDELAASTHTELLQLESSVGVDQLQRIRSSFWQMLSVQRVLANRADNSNNTIEVLKRDLESTRKSLAEARALLESERQQSTKRQRQAVDQQSLHLSATIAEMSQRLEHAVEDAAMARAKLVDGKTFCNENINLASYGLSLDGLQSCWECIKSVASREHHWTKLSLLLTELYRVTIKVATAADSATASRFDEERLLLERTAGELATDLRDMFINVPQTSFSDAIRSLQSLVQAALSNSMTIESFKQLDACRAAQRQLLTVEGQLKAALSEKLLLETELKQVERSCHEKTIALASVREGESAACAALTAQVRFLTNALSERALLSIDAPQIDATPPRRSSTCANTSDSSALQVDISDE